MKRVVREVLALSISASLAVFIFVALRPACRLLTNTFYSGEMQYILLSIGFSLTALILAWRLLRSRLGLPVPFIHSQRIRWIILAAYVATWAFGVPSVHSSLVRSEVSEYKRIRNLNHPQQRVWEAHPWIKLSFDMPLLPFVILSYHDYQVAGLYGWGGWDIHLWCGYRAIRIGSFATRIS